MWEVLEAQNALLPVSISEAEPRLKNCRQYIPELSYPEAGQLGDYLAHLPCLNGLKVLPKEVKFLALLGCPNMSSPLPALKKAFRPEAWRLGQTWEVGGFH